MTTELKDHLFLHVIVVAWGMTAVLGLLIETPPVEMVFFRTGLSALGILLIIWFRSLSLRLSSAKDFRLAMWVGLMIAAHWITFFLAARLSNASVCLAAMATMSLWTSVLEPIYYKKKIRGFEVSLGLLALIGMVVIFNVEFDYILGLVVALISAFLAALFTVINSKLTKSNHHFSLTFYEMLFANLGIALFLPFYSYFIIDGPVQLKPASMDWIYLLILAGVCTVFAYSYSIKLMKRLSAFTVNLSVNMEPIYGIILALIVFGESEEMSGGFYMGTSLIMLSVLAYPLLNRLYKRKAIETDILR